MHLKTNIEMSFVHIAVLALCPLMFVMAHSNYAIYFIVATCICYLISALVCLVFNKFFSRSVKVFVTAILSVFIVTLLDFVIEKYELFGLHVHVHEEGFLSVIATTILSIDIIYINTKAVAKNYLYKVLRAMFVFALMGFVYSVFKEFLAYGTVFEKQLFGFSGHAFCRTQVFNLLWMGIIAFVAEVIHKAIASKVTKKQIEYQKILKKIRNEKVFQYDNLRRQRLLANQIETNKIDGEKVEEINEKESANEVVDMNEITDKPPEEMKEGEKPAEEVKEVEPEEPETKKGKKKKNAKGAKVEKVFNKKPKEDNE